MFPTWVNASDFLDTDESFVTVAMHSEELDRALKDCAAQISDAVKNSYSGDLHFMCDRQGNPIPFLPVDGIDEYRLFSHILLFDIKCFEENEMSLKWMEYVDGVTIFPKLPHQLRKYHKKWERNCRVQNAVDNMKSELDMLDALNKDCVPPELAVEESGEDLDDAMYLDDNSIGAAPAPVGLLSFP